MAWRSFLAFECKHEGCQQNGDIISDLKMKTMRNIIDYHNIQKNKEFGNIFNLCCVVLCGSPKPDLREHTPKTWVQTLTQIRVHTITYIHTHTFT